MKNFVQGPITGGQLRAKRAAAGIPGHAVCRVIAGGMSRGKLSEIETGLATASEEDLQRIDAAINQIIRDRAQLSELAAKVGLRLNGVRL